MQVQDKPLGTRWVSTVTLRVNADVKVVREQREKMLARGERVVWAGDCLVEEMLLEGVRLRA